jgi:CRISPR-associated protein Csb2
MFAIGIRYLCGWAMATHPTDRERPEWPPHPDRVFMALAAAHFETDGGRDEYAALKLLSSSPSSPALFASGHHPRQTVTTFVPVNDDSSPISKKGGAMVPSGSMAIGRDRQPRSFPVAVPEQDTVFLIWPDLDIDETSRTALADLCRKVSALGHSASLVQMWVEDNPPEPNLAPTDQPGAPQRLRVPWPGRMEELQDRYQAELRPNPTGWKGYAKPVRESQAPRFRRTVFSHDLIVLRRLDSRRPLGLESTLLLTEALRGAVMKSCPDPPPEWISGHEGPEGPPSQKPHLAFLPLSHVGRQHADGRLLGMALALPRNVWIAEQRRCLSPLLFDQNGLPRTIPLTLGELGVWNVALDDREDRPWTLRPEVWTSAGSLGPSDTWSTVTPIVLDRYPKDRNPAARASRVEQIIAASCDRVWSSDQSNTIKVVKVVATAAPLFVGVPHARDFPPLCSGPNGAKRFHTHALIVFSEPIIGPLLIGAGRYRGYGLCRPWREEGR